ncbi:hypothetical protein KAS08_05830 [Candidatus Pacearchaeota archaeon]|nr:hypothetical protein [Candidatus Pacearchaeota archaeon]
MEDADLIGLFDMDDTLVDYTGGITCSLNAIKGENEPRYKSPIPRNPLNKTRVDVIRNVPGWWENLKRLKLGFDVYELAKELGYQLHVATQGPIASSNAWTEKFNWVQREIPEAIITITRKKSLIYGRFLVDDYPEFLEAWLNKRPRGIGIMPAHPHNEGFSHPRVVRYDGTNLDEVKEKLLWAKNRK